MKFGYYLVFVIWSFKLNYTVNELGEVFVTKTIDLQFIVAYLKAPSRNRENPRRIKFT